MREIIIRDGQIDTTRFVTTSEYERQTEAIYDSLDSQRAGIDADLEESITTNLLRVTGNGSVDGAFAATGAITSSASLTGPYVSATDPAATSTFAGALTVGTTTSSAPLTIDGAAYLASTTAPSDTDDRLYNQGGLLYWGGQAFAGSTIGTWSTDGTHVWRESGRVGIGTATPRASLDLVQQTNGQAMFYAQRATDTAPAGDFITYTDAAGNALFRVDNSGNLLAGGIINTGSQTITATSSPQFRVQYDANNEITTAVSATGATTLAVNGASPSLTFTPGSDAITSFAFTNASSTSILSIDTLNGRVGIGDISPTALFTVGAGDLFQVNSSGAIATATGITSSGAITFSSLPSGFLKANGSGVLATSTIGVADLTAEDFGDFTCNGTACAFDADTVSVDEIADGDHGFFSYTGGVAALDTDGLTSASLAGALSDETGSGSAVFSVSPTFTGTASFADYTAANGTTTNATSTNFYAASLRSAAAILTSATSTDLFATTLSLGNALAVSYGGSGATSLTGLLLGNGTSAFTATTTLSASYIEDVYVRNAGDSISGNLNFSGSAANIALGSNFLSGDGGDEGIFVDATGNVGIGTTTPPQKLTVTGNARITGAFYDSTNSAGSNGDVLQSSGSGTAWVATSTLGFAPSFSDSAQLAALLSDETGTGSAVFSASPTLSGTVNAAALTLTSTLTMSGSAANIALSSNWLSGDGGDEGVFISSAGNVGIGTTSPSYLLDISKSQNTETSVRVQNTTDGTSAIAALRLSGSGGDGVLSVSGASYTAISGFEDSFIIDANVGISNGVKISAAASTADINFYAGGRNSDDLVMTITDTGNVGIGTDAPSAGLTVNANGANIARFGNDFGNNVALTIENTSGAAKIRFDQASDGSANKDLAFFAGSSEVVRLRSSGNVGIGTTNPFGKLAVEQTGGNQIVARYNSSNARGGIYTGATSGATFFGSNLTHSSGNVFNHDTNGLAWYIGNPGGQAFFGIGVASSTAGSSAGTDSNTNARLIIDSSGNVGIGITTPATKLTVTDNNANLEVSGQASATYNGVILEAIDRQGTGRNDFNLYTSSGSIKLFTGGTERVRVSNSGNVGIGTSNPSAQLHISNNENKTKLSIEGYGSSLGYGISLLPANDSATPIRFLNAAGSTVGTVTTDGSATTYNTTSDRRLKENIDATKLSLDTLMQLPVRDFSFKNDPEEETVTGFIAQELYEIFPEAVSTNGESGSAPLTPSSTPWSVDYGRVTPLIVKSVQDLNLDLRALLVTGSASSTSTFAHVLEAENGSVWSKMVGLAQGFVDGVLTLTEARIEYVRSDYIEANTIRSTDELCIGNTCLTEEEVRELRSLLDDDGSEAQPDSPEPEPSSDPEPVPPAEPATTDPLQEATTTEPLAGSGPDDDADDFEDLDNELNAAPDDDLGDLPAENDLGGDLTNDDPQEDSPRDDLIVPPPVEIVAPAPAP